MKCIITQDEMNLSENLRIPIRQREKAIKVDMLVQFMSKQSVSYNILYFLSP